jgi:hypothetical protein
MARCIVCILLLALALTGCGGGGGGKATPSVTPKAAKGDVSPGFNLTAVDGSQISFKPSENPNGDVTMLLFWSYSWDPNVKTLLSRAAELHERYAPRGLRIISVTYYEEDTATLRTFLAENKTPFPVAVGRDSTYEKFAVKVIPTIILIDKDGKTVERWEGHFSTEELSQKISPYLPGRDGNSTS